MTFYLLSMITGVLECGWIAYGAVHGLPLWQLLCFPLAYHLGNMFPKPFSLGKRTLIVLSGLCCAVSVAMLFPIFSEQAEMGPAWGDRPETLPLDETMSRFVTATADIATPAFAAVTNKVAIGV